MLECCCIPSASGFFISQPLLDAVRFLIYIYQCTILNNNRSVFIFRWLRIRNIRRPVQIECSVNTIHTK